MHPPFTRPTDATSVWAGIAYSPNHSVLRSRGQLNMKRLLVLLAFLAAPATAVKADVIIDNFTTNQSVTVPIGTVGIATNQVGGPGIIGGFRDLILTKLSGTPQASADAFFDGSIGTLFFSAGVGN